MALNQDDHFAAFASLTEACRLTWALRLPYLVLVVLVTVPWAAAMALGAFDQFGTYAALGADVDPTAQLAAMPWSEMSVMWVGSYVLMTVFGIFWYRYMLLGPGEALKFGFGAFNGMVWRSLGYGLAVLIPAILLLIVVIFLVSLIVGVAVGLLSAIMGEAAFFIAMPLMLVAYAVPLAFLARLSFCFPAIALGESLSFRESWARTKGSAWRMAGAFALASLAPFLFVYALQFAAVYGLFGLNMLQPENTAAVLELWWIGFILSPLYYLPVALCFSLVAIAYRDLTGTGAVELPAGASLA